MHSVTIHTDGSCLGNPGPGGWAAVLKLNGRDCRREFCGGFRLTTTHRMEILAVVEALARLKEPCAVELFTDSKYVCDSVEKGWIWGWRKKDWVKADRKPVLNADLWKRLVPLLSAHTVKLRWLKGHAGHPENERCDALARQEAAKPDLPLDQGYRP